MKYLILITMLLSFSLLGSYKEISTKEVKKLIDTKAEYTLVDSLTAIHYGVDHVPTSINIQHKEVKEKLNLLPKDKSKMVIFYCMGPKCFFSKNNAKEAISLGFTNVYVWSAGIPDWKKKGYKTTKGGSFLPQATINFVKPNQLNGNLDKVVAISLFNKKERIKGYCQIVK